MCVQHYDFGGEPAVSAAKGKLSAFMQGQHRLRLSIVDLQNRLMMSRLGVGGSAEDTNRLVRDVGFR